MTTERAVISVLIPTRGRPENLRASIDSCYALAAHPERVEVIVGADLDDPCLPEIVDIASEYDAVLWVSDVRYGYPRLHEYFNGLARRARGAWLIHWNDDSEMRTRGWDDLLCDAPPVAVQFLRIDERPTADPTFPVTSRAVYEAMGHLSLNAHCDAWISDVSWWAGCQVQRDDIVIKHHLLADQTARERTDEMTPFKGPEQTALRAKDIAAVKALLGK